MVHDQRALVRWDVDIELEEQRLKSGRCRLFAGEGEEDISFLLHEVEDVVRAEGWTKAFRLCGEEDGVVVSSFAMLEEGEVAVFGRQYGQVEASSCKDM